MVRFLVLVVVWVAGLTGNLAGSANVQAAVIYVSKSGNAANDGRSWATAKPTFRAAMLVAVAGDEVWAAAGTYTERVVPKAGVALYGGFAGTETELAQRDWSTNATIIDGSAGGSVMTPPSGATATTRIDGFTLRNGAGTLSDSKRYGGAVYCNSSSPTIANNTITGNSATYGGIYCGSSSSPTIINNTIVGNSVSYAGGIYCDASSPTAANSAIAGDSSAHGLKAP